VPEETETVVIGRIDAAPPKPRLSDGVAIRDVRVPDDFAGVAHVLATITLENEAMELNGALSNPLQRDKTLLLKVSKLYHTALARVGKSPQPPTTTARSHVRAVRRALVEVLAEAGSDLRLFELQRRVEERLGRELPRTRFKDYVNDQSKGRSPLLERLGDGRYRLRNPEGTSIRA
jgi:hypothetical protein